jgi:hypothetical protein
MMSGMATALSATAIEGCNAAPAQTDASVSVRSFGALGDGRADDTRAVQAAYDSLARGGGGTLLFPRGTYRVALEMTSRLVHLRGEGREVTILQPTAADGAALRALYAVASWDPVSISDLSLRGNSPLRGIGLAHGHELYVRNDEYVGRTILNRVGFENLDRSISRPYGNIGLVIEDCTFSNANYHIWTRGSSAPPADPMHGGNLVVARSRFSGFKRAMLFLDCQHPGGQITFSDNVIEQGSGFVIYIRSFNGAGATPGIWFIRNWNEATATGRTVEIEGTQHDEASFLFARQCAGMILFEDSPLGTLDVSGALIETRNCSLDNLRATRVDAGSQLLHRDARQFTGLAPGICLSVTGPTVPAGLRTPWFRMPLPRGKTRAYDDMVLQHFDGTTAIPFTGSISATTAPQEGGALIGNQIGQRLALARGANVWPAPGFSAAARIWLVTLYIYRRVQGGSITLQLTGASGMSGMVELESRTWELLVNISENPGSAVGNLGLWHRTADQPAALQIGGIAILAFTSRQRATEFANSGLFPGDLNAGQC